MFGYRIPDGSFYSYISETRINVGRVFPARVFRICSTNLGAGSSRFYDAMEDNARDYRVSAIGIGASHFLIETRGALNDQSTRGITPPEVEAYIRRFLGSED